MKLAQPLYKGRFLRRYKRFFADVILENGQEITAHLANSGSMKTCLGRDWPVLLSYHDNPRRKLAYSCEWIYNGAVWIGINTHHANALVSEALAKSQIQGLQFYNQWLSEVPVANHRFDFLLYKGPPLPPKLKRKYCLDYLRQRGSPFMLLEIKSVSMAANGLYLFPDAVTQRGQKQTQLLIELQNKGIKTAILYLIQRADGHAFTLAAEIDSSYARLVRQARDSGTNIFVYGTRMHLRHEIYPQTLIADFEVADQVPWDGPNA